MTHTITPNEIENLADLSRLQLTEDEKKKFAIQINETVHYIENLSELNTDKVIGTNSITETENVYFEDGTSCTRMLTQKEALANATSTKDGFFKVEKIM